MISALTVIFAVRPRPRTSVAMMMAGIPTLQTQPESPEEEALCKEAMEGCPVEAIAATARRFL